MTKLTLEEIIESPFSRNSPLKCKVNILWVSEEERLGPECLLATDGKVSWKEKKNSGILSKR